MTTVRTGVVLLAGDGASTRIVYHALAAAGLAPVVILEGHVTKGELFGRRLRRLGVLRVAGQLGFGSLVAPLLRWQARGRLAEILREAGLTDAPIDGEVVQVDSVNGPTARDALARLTPRVVVVNGTRILGPETLAATGAPFLNLHAGMTPEYRGVHGGYWALAEGRPERAGVTLHYVDRGVDTGAVIGQARIIPTARDSFVTYPYLQLVAGIPMLLDAVRALLAGRPVEGRAVAAAGTAPRTHPTLWEYLHARLSRGIR